jgi:aminoglycoside 6'-N-acetyltransferase I
MRIVEFSALSKDALQRAACILHEAFANTTSVFDAAAACETEVQSFVAGRERGAVAVLEEAEVVGWIGWLEAHSRSWELHPLAVDPRRQGRGIGPLLVRELERRAAAAGVLTIWLGSDDEYGGTSLYGADLYPDVLRHAATVRQVNRHPIEFYRKLGFEVVGVLPDVNGFGKPDILMAKRVPGVFNR